MVGTVSDVTIRLSNRDIARIVADRLDDCGIEVLGYTHGDELSLDVVLTLSGRVVAPGPFKFHGAETVAEALCVQTEQVTPHEGFHTAGI